MFPTTLTPATLAEALDSKGLSEAQAEAFYDEAYDLLDDAFAEALRPVPAGVADTCMIRVARSLREGRKAANAGQLSKVNNSDRVAAARAHADPLASVAHIFARYVVPL